MHPSFGMRYEGVGREERRDTEKGSDRRRGRKIGGEQER
jgi:hypothetical protein